VEQVIEQQVKRAVTQAGTTVLNAEGHTAAGIPRTRDDALTVDGKTWASVYDSHRASLKPTTWTTRAADHEHILSPYLAEPAPEPAAPAPAAALLQAGADPAPADGATVKASEAGESGRVKTPEEGSPSKLRIEPLTGSSGKPIEVAPLSDVGGNLANTAEYANMHSYQEDLRGLVRELDASEFKAQSLRMLIVEKDNFLEGLQKREKLLRLDMSEHKGTLAALSAHVQAVEARIERLKQERQVAEIAAQKHQFDIASMKLQSEVSNVQQVSGALDARIKRLGAGISANQQDEMRSMRMSLQPAVASGHEVDDGSANAEAEAMADFSSAGQDGDDESFVQRAARSLRGASE